jgi:hypothetical protein
MSLFVEMGVPPNCILCVSLHAPPSPRPANRSPMRQPHSRGAGGHSAHWRPVQDRQSGKDTQVDDRQYGKAAD